MMTGRKLHIRTYGSGPPIVLIHGLAGSGIIWHKVVDKMQATNTLICVDLLGYGYSPKPWGRYSVEAHIAAIHKTLEEKGIEAFRIVGLSMGSILAAAYADTYPQQVHGLTLVGVPYFTSAKQARQALRSNVWCRLTIDWPLISGLFIAPFWALSRRSNKVRDLLAPGIYSPEVVAETVLVRYRAFASSLKRCMIDFRLKPVLDRLVPMPIVIVQGSDDSWTPIARVEQLTKFYPNIDVHRIEDVDHNIAVLSPESVAKVFASVV